MPDMEINAPLERDLWDDEQDVDVYESLAAESEPGAEALSRLGAGGGEDLEFLDDELVNHEDPYLQGLLGPLMDE